MIPRIRLLRTLALLALLLALFGCHGKSRAEVDATLNTTPTMSGLSADPSVLDVGDSSVLRAVVADADGDPLAFHWSSTCVGRFDDDRAPEPRFTLDAAPIDGRCRLSVDVEDGRGATAMGSLTLQVGARATVNVAPVIDSAFRSRSTVGGGESVLLGVTAHDPDGQALAFEWAASSGAIDEVVDSASDSQARWTSPTCTRREGATTIELIVRDAAGASTRELFGLTMACSMCFDGALDGLETDVDCGGASCAACEVGQRCVAARDCRAPPHATSTCGGGVCALAGCTAGFFDCDGSAANGCETASSATSCGACGDACASDQSCESGRCVQPAWSQVAPVLGRPVSIAIAPNDGGTPFTIYVGTADRGIYRSTDGSAWTSSGPASIVSVSSQPMPSSAFASLADGSVQMTRDGGASWAATPGAPGAIIRAWIGVPGVGPLGGASDGSGRAVVFRGQMGGASWSASTPFGVGVATSIAMGGGAPPSAIAYAAVSGSGGGVFKSTSVGSAVFEFTTTRFPETEVLSVATAPSSRSTVFAGTNGGGIYRSTDAGTSWSPMRQGLGNLVVHAIAVDPTNANLLYAGTASGVYLSMDAGTTWIFSGLSSRAVTSLAILNGVPSTVYATTDAGLFVTTTGGR